MPKIIYIRWKLSFRHFIKVDNQSFILRLIIYATCKIDLCRDGKSRHLVIDQKKYIALPKNFILQNYIWKWHIYQHQTHALWNTRLEYSLRINISWMSIKGRGRKNYLTFYNLQAFWMSTYYYNLMGHSINIHLINTYLANNIRRVIWNRLFM